MRAECINNADLDYSWNIRAKKVRHETANDDDDDDDGDDDDEADNQP